jgi:hypothetical protein
VAIEIKRASADVQQVFESLRHISEALDYALPSSLTLIPK